MKLYSLTAYAYSTRIEASATFKSEGAQVSVEFDPAETAELEALCARAYARHQTKLIEELSKPLETNLLAAPAPAFVQDADFSEVGF